MSKKLKLSVETIRTLEAGTLAGVHGGFSAFPDSAPVEPALRWLHEMQAAEERARNVRARPQLARNRR